MTILESTMASALEAAIRTRVAIDSKAKDSAAALNGKHIRLNVSEQRLTVAFTENQVKVESDSTVDAELELTGSMASVSQALVSNIRDNVVVTGDISLLEDFRNLFHPPFNTDDLAASTRATADKGIAAAKTAFEMASSQFENLRATWNTKEDLQRRIEELENRQSELDQRIQDLENR